MRLTDSGRMTALEVGWKYLIYLSREDLVSHIDRNGIRSSLSNSRTLVGTGKIISPLVIAA